MGHYGLTDAIRQSLSDRSWSAISDAYRADVDACENCGDPDALLDTNHIVPVRSGGTNGEWNLMALCPACHRRADHYFYENVVEPLLVP